MCHLDGRGEADGLFYLLPPEIYQHSQHFISFYWFFDMFERIKSGVAARDKTPTESVRRTVLGVEHVVDCVFSKFLRRCFFDLLKDDFRSLTHPLSI